LTPDHISELFSAFRPVTVRRLFGGAGLYADGVMFAILSKDVIYLKADDETRAAFEREESVPFSYQRRGENRAIMSFWRLPERLYDDPEELAEWAQRALLVARRSSEGSRMPKRGRNGRNKARGKGGNPSTRRRRT
jgi:DNA transformation protein and related proteins